MKKEINLKDIKRILIVNPFGIGDVLFTTPLIRNLRYYFPKSYIAYLCNKRTQYILENNPYIDEVFVFEKDEFRQLWRNSKIKFFKEISKFLKKLKKRNFDLCIDLSLNAQYGFFLKFLKIPYRVGFNFKNRGRFLTHPIPILGYENKHVVEFYLDVMRYLNLEPQDFYLELFLKEEDKKWAEDFLKDKAVKAPLIGICPAGGESWGKNRFMKYWAPEKFSELIERINKELRDATVILFSSKSERRQVLQILNLIDKKKVIDLSGRTSIGEFFSLISKLDLLITNDGGPLHVAVALGVRTISIFGPVDEKTYGPFPPDDTKHIVIKKDLSCRPCYRKFKIPICKYGRRCLNDIRPEEVFEAVKKLMRNEDKVLRFK